MTTALIFIAYVALGFGFTMELLNENPTYEKYGKWKSRIVAAAIFATWPVVMLVKLGIKAAE